MIAQGQDILAADLLALENRALQTLGTGTGSRGYGQIFNPVSVQGMDVATEHLNNLREMLNVARRHQLGNDTGFGTGLPVPTKRSDITASVITAYQNALNTIETASLTYGMPSMSVTGTLATVTRGNRWGPAQQISAMIDANWPTENEARWFFNSGGEVRIAFSHPSTNTRQDRAWNRTLARVGLIRFRAMGTIADGSQVGSPISGNGFYTIGGGQTPIYVGQGVDDTFDYLDARYVPPNKYAYKDSVFVYAYRLATGVRFQVVFQETNNEVNNSGTNASFSAMYATRYLRNRLIRLPSFINASPF